MAILKTRTPGILATMGVTRKTRGRQARENLGAAGAVLGDHLAAEAAADLYGAAKGAVLGVIGGGARERREAGRDEAFLARYVAASDAVDAAKADAAKAAQQRADDDEAERQHEAAEERREAAAIRREERRMALEERHVAALEAQAAAARAQAAAPAPAPAANADPELAVKLAELALANAKNRASVIARSGATAPN
jgi:translation initiation factor IF-2